MRVSFSASSVRTRHTASREEGVQESRSQRRPSGVGGLIPGAGEHGSPLSRQPPRVGEHNDEILGEAGFSPAEIAALADARVIVGIP